MQRRLGYLLAIAGFLLIGGTTLVPLPRQAAASAATSLGCLVCGEYGGVDVLANVLLFIPAGLGLRLLGLSTGKAVLVGFLVSLIVETLQLMVIPGRDASLSDLLTNTMGTLIGAALGSHWELFLHPSQRRAARLALLAGMLWLAVQSGTAFLLRPWAPPGPLTGAWGRIRPGRTPFDGSVKSALVSGISVLDHSESDGDLGDRLRKGDIHLTLNLVSGRNAPDWSPVFELRAHKRTVLGVLATGRDLVLQAPAHSYRLRLRAPMLRLPSALPLVAEQPVRLFAGEQQGVLRATWMERDGEHRSSQALSPSLGWSLMLPFDYAYGPGVSLLTGLWVAGLLLPVGYWSRRTRYGSYVISTALTALLAAGLGLVPLLGGYPPVHWSEWLAGAAGLAAGWVSHRAAPYFGMRCDSLSIKEFC